MLKHIKKEGPTPTSGFAKIIKPCEIFLDEIMSVIQHNTANLWQKMRELNIENQGNCAAQTHNEGLGGRDLILDILKQPNHQCFN